MPRISVITPVYNPTEEKWKISSESIQRQTSKDFEWILVDDGSENNPYIRDITLDKNYGPSVARNVGFQISSGDIITYLDMGDSLSDRRIEDLIWHFDNHKTTSLLFCAYDIVQNLRTSRFNPAEYQTQFIDFLKYQNVSIPMGVAHTRKPFVECGGFQRGIVCGEDGILWRRMVDILPRDTIKMSNSLAGTYFVSTNGQSRTQRRFEMGGFAFDGSKKDNGKYLDEDWFKNFHSNGLYD